MLWIGRYIIYTRKYRNCTNLHKTYALTGKGEKIMCSNFFFFFFLFLSNTFPSRQIRVAPAKDTLDAGHKLSYNVGRFDISVQNPKAHGARNLSITIVHFPSSFFPTESMCDKYDTTLFVSKSYNNRIHRRMRYRMKQIQGRVSYGVHKAAN